MDKLLIFTYIVAVIFLVLLIVMIRTIFSLTNSDYYRDDVERRALSKQRAIDLINDLKYPDQEFDKNNDPAAVHMMDEVNRRLAAAAEVVQKHIDIL